jgi:hypothetical protein
MQARTKLEDLILIIVFYWCHLRWMRWRMDHVS